METKYTAQQVRKITESHEELPMEIIRDMLRAFAAQLESPAVPDGWRVERLGTGCIRVVSPVGGPGGGLFYEDEGNLVQRLMYSLTSAMLAAPQPVCPKCKGDGGISTGEPGTFGYIVRCDCQPAAPAQDAPGLDERALFEAWAEEDLMGVAKDSNGDYLFQEARYSWRVWQARAALQVKANAVPETPAPGELKQCVLGLDESSVINVLVQMAAGDGYFGEVERHVCKKAAFILSDRAALSQRPDDTELLRDCRGVLKAYGVLSNLNLEARLAARLGSDDGTRPEHDLLAVA